jgi:hypothetical protein
MFETKEQYRDKEKLLLEDFKQPAQSEEFRNCNLSASQEW